ncbi:acetate/propionate family kinase [Aminobacter aganoensis]|uniref:Acetate kinase n=1 Tax=Aminobacter aganoensis TaxID=83264 RepID=A0A7X0KM79_9HYPH|nr:acetate/propionate family kinase [Aminobacter aganoensis]MBB6355798.1 acetate kinase [Aminobacter aganoensis]
MCDAILVLNAGSSSIKFGVYDVGKANRPVVAARGTLEMGASPRLEVNPIEAALQTTFILQSDGLAEGIVALVEWIEHGFGNRRLIACGHRIVHGGTAFFNPVLLTPSVIDAVDSLTPLAPLHQPRSIAPIRVMVELRPQLPQIGCFDTAFHRTIEAPANRFALPREYVERGIRRFGFHGLSYEYIATRLDQAGKADKRSVVAHLGNGASLCAMRNKRSLDTTMGFSALDGLVMGTRCGSIDPGVLLYLLQHEKMTLNDLHDLLYERSGLLGVSAESGDMRDLEASASPHAREAIELFVFRIAREVAALANTLGGLDCLVFTAGIGEHSAVVRKAVCERLTWMGVKIDDDKNQHHAEVISANASAVHVGVLPADEEIVIARHVARATLLRSDES